MSAAGRRLVRPRQGSVIGGVAAGVADYLGMDRKLVRVLFVLSALFGVGELVYIVLWVVVPRADF